MHQPNQNDEMRRHKIIQSLRDHGGEQTFYIGEISVPVSRCLIALVAEGIIDHVDNPEPLARTYPAPIDDAKRFERMGFGHSEAEKDAEVSEQISDLKANSIPESED